MDVNRCLLQAKFSHAGAVGFSLPTCFVRVLFPPAFASTNFFLGRKVGRDTRCPQQVVRTRPSFLDVETFKRLATQTWAHFDAKDNPQGKSTSSSKQNLVP